MSSIPLTEKGNATRDRILSRARQMLVDKGYNHLVMRNVANACDMKLGNLQYYFPSHDALLRAIIEEETKRDLDIVQNTIDQHQDSQQRLRSVVNILVTRWRGESAVVFSTMYLLVLHDESYQSTYRNAYATYYKLLEEVISEVSPKLVKQEVKTRARLVCALIDGAPYQTDIGRRSRFLSRIEDQACEIAMSGV